MSVVGSIWGVMRRSGGPFRRGGRLFLAMAMLTLACLALQPAHAAPGDKMLVESDQLIYDYDRETVSAVGNVKIYYTGYTLQADTVTYLQRSGRLLAKGRVKLTDSTGVEYYSEQLDVTDDFADGFVESLRVETPEKTRFAAERADRSAGETTTFTKGVYTACEACKDRPEKPPMWQIKAARIIHKQSEKMVYFEDASFEFFGLPIAWLPYFSTPDPTVKRKSGILSPTIGYSDPAGFSVSVPYFWAAAPNYDLTVTPTYYTRQGFMGDFEWRHRLETGEYSIHAAGISQADKYAFTPPGQLDWRGGIRTKGDFYLSDLWTFGWDATISSDRLFTRDYDILNDDTSETISQVHLTGLKDRNYFDARLYYFTILTDQSNPDLPYPEQFDQGRQAVVHPVIDHDYTFDNPVYGGEVTLKSNLTVLSREEDDYFPYPGYTQYTHGIAGNFARASTELAWNRQIIGPMGQVIKPFAFVRGDVFGLNPTGSPPPDLTDDSFAGRIMPAIGVDWRWPILAMAGPTTHIIEPIAQLIVRPDEMGAGTLPNEDAQSLVFDDTNLFEYDKFSGWDRVEGGTRLNLGLRYAGTLGNGASIDGLIGQSYHLAGVNPYASPDLADVGAFSGLETDVSDVVAKLSVDTGFGPRFTTRGRFDEKSLQLQRAEFDATNAIGPVTASAGYFYLRENANSGVIGDQAPQSVVRAAASVNFVENWRAFGSIAYDLTHEVVASNSLGVAFDNDCLTLSLAYSETRDDYSDTSTSRTVSFRLQLRTLGEGTISSDLRRFDP